MDCPNTFLLKDTETFMRGDLDNVTVASGHILLDRVRGSYVPYGCYTSQVIAFPAFDALRISWNVCAPKDTAVELQVRVLIDGNWSAWCGFGRWSLFFPRVSVPPMVRGPLRLTGDELALEGKVASRAQVRIYLYTKGDALTPAVGLLGVSVHPVSGLNESGRPLNKKLRLIPYSAARRAPALQQGMDLACCIAALSNRWGADILPEELAQALYDHVGTTNFSFAAAAAAAWGFPAWVVWCDLAGLRSELRSGYGVVAALRDDSVNLDRADEEKPTDVQKSLAPAARRYVAVRGFSDDTVLLMDPRAADTDFETEIEMPLKKFLRDWTGQALFLRARQKRSADTPELEGGRPVRTTVNLRPKPDHADILEMYLSGKAVSLDDSFTAGGGLLAWTGREERPHATTGHRLFHFVQPEGGGIRLPVDPAARQRFTVYAFEPSGSMLVGEAVL